MSIDWETLLGAEGDRLASRYMEATADNFPESEDYETDSLVSDTKADA